MSKDTIDEILRRKQADKTVVALPKPDSQADKFYSILVGEGVQENFLEIKMRNGVCTCFPYSSIIWMVYDPDHGITIDMAGYAVSIQGRGLSGRLFDGIKQKRVAWVKEADHELQDHRDNDIFIAEITITPPEGFAEEESPAE